MINPFITTMKIDIPEKDLPQVIKELSKDGWEYIGPDKYLEKKVTVVFYKTLQRSKL